MHSKAFAVHSEPGRLDLPLISRSVPYNLAVQSRSMRPTVPCEIKCNSPKAQYKLYGNGLDLAVLGIVLRARYALSGTELAYGGTSFCSTIPWTGLRPPTLTSPTLPPPSPVLTDDRAEVSCYAFAMPCL
eukprot:773675-Rhodomonas_salina.1